MLRDPPRPGPAQRPAHVRGIRIGVQASAHNLGLGAGCASIAGSRGERRGGKRGGALLGLPLVLANRPLADPGFLGGYPFQAKKGVRKLALAMGGGFGGGCLF